MLGIIAKQTDHSTHTIRLETDFSRSSSVQLRVVENRFPCSVALAWLSDSLSDFSSVLSVKDSCDFY